MATRILPTFAGLYHYRYTVDLDDNGTRFTLEFHFNPRDLSAGTDGAWWVDLYDAKGSALVLDRKLAIGTDLWGPYKAKAGMPLGKLDVVDVSGLDVEASRDDLGIRVLPRYRTGEDAAA